MVKPQLGAEKPKVKTATKIICVGAERMGPREPWVGDGEQRSRESVDIEEGYEGLSKKSEKRAGES